MQNPQPPSNVVEFNFKEGRFVPMPPTTQTILLLEIEGSMLCKDSDEAKFQLEGNLDCMYAHQIF
jgi:dynein intermediate chain 1